MDVSENVQADIVPAVVGEINRLHHIAEEHANATRMSASVALSAAWKAGRLLCAERARIRQESGHGAWEKWVKANFEGSLSTAQRYQRLCKSVTDVTDLGTLGLRTAYQAIGIVGPPRPSGGETKLLPMAPHVVWAQKLIAYLQRAERSDRADSEQVRRLRSDMAPLFLELRRLESQNAPVDGET